MASADTLILRHGIARRILAIFALCAVIPLAALLLVSWRQVVAELEEQSEVRSRALVKNVTMSAFTELQSASRTAQRIAEAMSSGNTKQDAVDWARDLGLGAWLETATGTRSLFAGATSPPPHFGGATAVGAEALAGASHAAPRLYRLVDEPDALFVRASAAQDFVWIEVPLERLVFDDGDLLLFDSNLAALSGPWDFVGGETEHLRRALENGTIGVTKWDSGGDEQRWTYRDLRLSFLDGAPRLLFVLSEPTSALRGPIRRFNRTLMAGGLLSLFVILLLSIRQIRRAFAPLDELTRGTRDVAEGRFGSRVEVSSGNEFEELGQSFNAMARNLGSQFETLSKLQEIARHALSKRTPTELIERSLQTLAGDHDPTDANLCGVLRCPSVGTGGRWTIRTGDQSFGAVGWLPDELDRELSEKPALRLSTSRLREMGIPEAVLSDERTFRLHRLKRDDERMVLLFGTRAHLGDNERDAVAQLADQLALALDSTEHLEALENIKWGTLTAFARAVDAKSEWTSGHSERVAQLGVEIGRRLELGEEELEVLHRGGLLHDVGKIGVPAAILDKPGRLTADEYDIMKSHVEKGVRIIEPMAEHKDILPILWEHHERLDGKGYPRGLGGSEISLHGRIFAVADVYDALTSARPYRPAVPVSKVLRIMDSDEGHFDRDILEVLKVLVSDQVGFETLAS